MPFFSNSHFSLYNKFLYRIFLTKIFFTYEALYKPQKMPPKIEKPDKNTNDEILKHLKKINTKLSTLTEKFEKFYELPEIHSTNNENSQMKNNIKNYVKT